MLTNLMDHNRVRHHHHRQLKVWKKDCNRVQASVVRGETFCICGRLACFHLLLISKVYMI